MSARISGVWAAVVTPVNATYAPDAPRALRYYRDLLDAGCDGINLLGTTGEAMSMGLSARLTLMEAVAASGFPLERAMCGTGAAALDDCERLTRAAFDLGFTAALVMPPFFFGDIADDGVIAYFDALLARTHSPGKRVLLYNFPKMSGITFHPDLVDRLVRYFPEAIVGMKDSSNDRALQRSIVERQPALAVFPGTEEHLGTAKIDGLAGCISGSVALWPRLARSVYEGASGGEERELVRNRQSLAGRPLIGAVRERIAREQNDDTWLRAIPPLIAPAQ